jgi:hypothetical protein
MDQVVCSTCRLDLTDTYDPDSREPCPNCGGLTRTFQAVVAAGRLRLSGSAVGLVVQVPMIDNKGEVFAPEIRTSEAPSPDTLATDELALRFEHLVRTFPPRTTGDKYMIELLNPDTGFVAQAQGDDAETAWRNLAEPFGEDV